MTSTNNPTAMSAVIGEEIELAPGRGRRARVLTGLIMPAVLLAFAAFLLIGIVTMRVPEGAAFPGPRFFPGIIAAGLALFAVILGIAAFRGPAAEPAAGPAAEPAAGPAAEAEPAAGPAAEAEPGSPAPVDAEPGSPDGAPPARLDWRSFAWVVLSFLAFALLLPVLGWIIAAGFLFWGVARGFGLRRPIASLVAGCTVSSIIYIVFDMALGMSLPSGVLGWGF